MVVGVHTPEFPFERDVDNVRWAAKDMAVEYPIALDSDYAVWRAFSNNYWPAVYIADAEGRIRHHHFGEGAYEECERVIQMLLGEAGRSRRRLTTWSPSSPTASRLRPTGRPSVRRRPISATSRPRTSHLPGGAEFDVPRSYVVPDPLELNQWALSGDWTVARGASVSNAADGRIAFRFHARDVNLVMGPPARGASVPFRVLVDGQAPGASHGLDVDEDGSGTVAQQRLHQLVRQQGSIEDRTFEIAFLAPGAEAYCFTFG